MQEDLDVVAFSYVPVPYTVTPFISSFNKHPDYLIHLSQSHGSCGKQRNSGSSGSNSSSNSIAVRGAGGCAVALSTLRESPRSGASCVLLCCCGSVSIDADVCLAIATFRSMAT